MAYLRCGYAARRLSQEPVRPLQAGIGLKLRHRHHCPQAQPATILTHLPQFRNTGQTHQTLVMHYLLFELAQQVTAASNRARLAIVCGQQLHGFMQTYRFEKHKGSHDAPFPWTRMACNTRCGVKGTSCSQTPVALATALATAAKTGTT